MKNTIKFMLMVALCFGAAALIAHDLNKQSNTLINTYSDSTHETYDLEYGLILNRDYTITVIDLETDEITVSTIDSLGYHINKLQE